jgi:ribosomal protein S27AE
LGKYTTEQLLQIFHSKHGGKYIYPSDLSGLRVEDRIPICCSIKGHGVFYQTVLHHMRGQGCPKCGQIAANKSHIIQRWLWIERFEKLHGKGKYNYSKLPQSPKANEEFPIFCVTHGEFFSQTPNHHLYSKQGCPKCGAVTRWKKINADFITRKDFITRYGKGAS